MPFRHARVVHRHPDKCNVVLVGWTEIPNRALVRMRGMRAPRSLYKRSCPRKLHQRQSTYRLHDPHISIIIEMSFPDALRTPEPSARIPICLPASSTSTECWSKPARMRICLSLRNGSFSVAVSPGIILTKVSGWELRREVISVAKRMHGVWFQEGEIFLIASSSDLASWSPR